ncbi:MAG: alpha-rhamnosidase, partial [Clostridia bacterium]|nr:alpha-rhamnosidase [Clostridia bacterium]
TPIYLFGKYYLGVTPTSPAYETFKVEPQLGGLNEIKGIVPLPRGEVRVEMDRSHVAVTATKRGGRLIVAGKEYELPENERVEIKL